MTMMSEMTSGNADGDELCWRFGGAKPGSGSEAGKDAEQLKLFRTRGVWEWGHLAPIKISE